MTGYRGEASAVRGQDDGRAELASGGALRQVQDNGTSLQRRKVGDTETEDRRRKIEEVRQNDVKGLLEQVRQERRNNQLGRSRSDQEVGQHTEKETVEWPYSMCFNGDSRYVML